MLCLGILASARVPRTAPSQTSDGGELIIFVKNLLKKEKMLHFPFFAGATRKTRVPQPAPTVKKTGGLKKPNIQSVQFFIISLLRSNQDYQGSPPGTYSNSRRWLLNAQIQYASIKLNIFFTGATRISRVPGPAPTQTAEDGDSMFKSNEHP